MHIQRRTSRHLVAFTLIVAGSLVGSSCDVKRELPGADDAEVSSDAPTPAPDQPSSPAPRFLYVASGACFGGDVTAGAVPAGSNTVARYNIDSREFSGVVIDYNAGASDSPVGLIDYSESQLLVLIENTGGRRIDIVDKLTGAASTYLTSSSLNGILRDISPLPDGGFLVAKSTAIERFNSNKARITSGANPFINAPGGACATSATWMVGATRLLSGKFAFIHSNTNPNNELGIISASGYGGASDCLYAQAAFNTAARPTALLEEQVTGDLLVAYGSATPAANAIYSFRVNSTSGAVSGALAAYTDYGYVSAPSKMYQDPATGSIYIASARAAYSSIEKMSYDSASRLLVRNETFATNSVYTKCVAGMVAGQ